MNYVAFGFNSASRMKAFLKDIKEHFKKHVELTVGDMVKMTREAPLTDVYPFLGWKLGGTDDFALPPDYIFKKLAADKRPFFSDLCFIPNTLAYLCYYSYTKWPTYTLIFIPEAELMVSKITYMNKANLKDYISSWDGKDYETLNAIIKFAAAANLDTKMVIEELYKKTSKPSYKKTYTLGDSIRNVNKVFDDPMEDDNDIVVHFGVYDTDGDKIDMHMKNMLNIKEKK